MLNVEMDDGWNSDEEEKEEEVGEEEGSEDEKEPEVTLSRKDRKKLYHLKVGEKKRDDA